MHLAIYALWRKEFLRFLLCKKILKFSGQWGGDTKARMPETARLFT
jgi:hypothetical protein